MIDYSFLLPPDEMEAQRLLSDTRGIPGHVRLMLSLGASITLFVRNHPGGDGMTLPEWHDLGPVAECVEILGGVISG